jgi:2,3-bisphosphoglycerate-independent phosphoglycerate mutase
VPVILVDDEGKNSHLNQGTGIDIAPTLLQLLQQPQPQEMTGRSLILGS